MDKTISFTIKDGVLAVLLAVGLICLGPIGLVLIVLIRRSWWEKWWVKAIAIGWSVLYTIAFISAAASPRLEENSQAMSSEVSPAEEQDEDDESVPLEEESPEAEVEEGTSAETATPEGEVTTQPVVEEQPARSYESMPTNASVPAVAPEPMPEATPEQTNTNSRYVHGYCKDGTEVYGNPSADGRANACYGHKGWMDEY